MAVIYPHRNFCAESYEKGIKAKKVSSRRGFEPRAPEPHSGTNSREILHNILKSQHFFSTRFLHLFVHTVHAVNNIKYLEWRRLERLHIGYTKTKWQVGRLALFTQALLYILR